MENKFYVGNDMNVLFEHYTPKAIENTTHIFSTRFENMYLARLYDIVIPFEITDVDWVIYNISFSEIDWFIEDIHEQCEADYFYELAVDYCDEHKIEQDMMEYLTDDIARKFMINSIQNVLNNIDKLGLYDSFTDI